MKDFREGWKRIILDRWLKIEGAAPTPPEFLAEEVVDALQPELVELLAKIAEYEHALEHVADIKSHDRYEQQMCLECAALAQSALDGVNRQDFREQVED